MAQNLAAPVYEGEPDSWAYRWTFTCLINGGLTALPNRNLVSNVGFGLDSTHTTVSFVDTSIGQGVDPHQHPSFLLRDAAADSYTYKNVFGGRWERFPFSLIRFLKRVVFIIINKIKNFSSR